ncbi:MAG: DUF5977 domain-containing protein [Chitinophagaceae bacterium]
MAIVFLRLKKTLSRYWRPACLLFFCYCLFSLPGVAQPTPNADQFLKMVDFLPPAPNAASIAKAGIFALNKNTGAPSINIPLYTLQGRKLSMNIGLNYATNGVKIGEIASRVGMGWSMNAGGVVTRIVRGSPDEKVLRKQPWSPVGINWSTFNFMKAVSESDNYTGIDAQPDLFTFNFNGQSGSFILDNQLQVVQIPSGSLKIEKDFAAGAAWNFKIITAEGIIYFFGGSTATEKTKREQTCGKTFDEFLSTSWYLKKIMHPSGETIDLTYTALDYTYDNGTTETRELVTELLSVQENCGFGQTTPQLVANSCINYTRTQGYYLSSVTSGFATAVFNYTSRPDCSDVLLSSVDVFNLINGSSRVKKFDLYYLNTASGPYLSMIRDNSADLSSGIFYQFMYNDPQSRPGRNSKSQDHWGYYNGKSNETLLPLIPDLVNPASNTYYYYFSSIQYADREADFKYASKGMLKKILYPTGGIDSIAYEPNTVSTVTQKRHNAEYSCDVTGTGLHTTVTKSIPFYIDVSQSVKLDIETICNAGDCPDSLHNIGSVAITGPLQTEEVLRTGTNKTSTYSLIPGSYMLVLKANGTPVTTRVKITYKSSGSQGQENNIVGGVRVKELFTGNPAERPLYKRYYYGFPANLDGSSLIDVYAPVYLKIYKENRMNVQHQGGNTVFTQCIYEHTCLYANSLRSLFDYSSSLVSYASVTESIGENFEGGGSRTEFMVGSDQMGAVAWGEPVHDAPFTNSSIFYNGKILREYVLKKAPGDSLIIIKKNENVYVEDERGFKSVSGYAVFRKNALPVAFDTTCISSTAQSSNVSCWQIVNIALGSFDMMEYTVYAPWTYLQSTTETIYDENGQNPVTNLTRYYYDNPLHQQVTRIETNSSKGELLKTTNQYPHEMASGNNIYAKMVSENIIAAVVHVNTERNQTILAEAQTNYQDWGNGLLEPASLQRAFKGASLETEGVIESYDAFGNITQYRGKDGITNAIVWGYGNYYPVAKISGATYVQAIAHLSVNINVLQGMDGEALRTELNRIRTGLPAAFVTTYTYVPNVGVNSITDQNNLTSKFGYDSFGRLYIVRDPENNIVKTVQYNYSGPSEETGYRLYTNTAQSQAFICQNCPSGTVGSTVVYAIPENTYFSFVSVTDANEKALAAIQAKGQAYANSYGYCSNVLPCTGVDKKQSGCNCLTGFKVYTGSVDNGNGTWSCEFHYHWADGSNSQNYYETSATPCGNEL